MSVYSERFIYSAVPGQAHTYVVPAGKRAVLRCITAVSYGAAGGDVFVNISGVDVWARHVPDGSSLIEGNFRIVMYSGEFVQIYMVADAMFCTVSGYLFADTQELDAPEADTDLEWQGSSPALHFQRDQRRQGEARGA